MIKFNFDSLDKEAAEAVHFVKALLVLSKTNKRSESETATLLLRAFDSFRGNHPYSGMEFSFYNYKFSTGFCKDAEFTTQSREFLVHISRRREYYADPNPNYDGIYYVDNDEITSKSYCSFYFKMSELLRFLIKNDMPIPHEFEHALPDAQKSYAFYDQLIKKDAARAFAAIESEDEELDKFPDLEERKSTWSSFSGKDTALMMIAGLSVALEKTGGRYIRGGKLNKSAVARAAIDAINEHGEGTEITTKALTDLLNEAISTKVAKLED
ncbi:TPA: hypothetical protein L9W62_000074 [Klebsiella pneumoniae]|nr:hypothetical protein [Klebsiella pneumoniae]